MNFNLLKCSELCWEYKLKHFNWLKQGFNWLKSWTFCSWLNLLYFIQPIEMQINLLKLLKDHFKLFQSLNWKINRMIFFLQKLILHCFNPLKHISTSGFYQFKKIGFYFFRFIRELEIAFSNIVCTHLNLFFEK